MEVINLHDDPFEQFNQWYQQVKQSDELDPDAMAMATATKDAKPSVRIVLYKGISQGGFLVFTNYCSRKSAEISENPYAALAFYWPRVYRQVRIEGTIEKVSPEESEQYFQTRSREAQISAWASRQGQEIPDRSYLIDRHSEIEEDFSSKIIPCPDFWGGFRLVPTEIEFWQGQEHRLHDRFCYRKKDEGWTIVRLSP